MRLSNLEIGAEQLCSLTEFTEIRNQCSYVSEQKHLIRYHGLRAGLKPVRYSVKIAWIRATLTVFWKWENKMLNREIATCIMRSSMHFFFDTMVGSDNIKNRRIWEELSPLHLCFINYQWHPIIQENVKGRTIITTVWITL